MIARVFAPREWDRQLRWSLGTFGGPGILLLFIAYLQGDGLGQRMRRLSATEFGTILRTLNHRLMHLSLIALPLAMGIWILRGNGFAPALGFLPFGLLLLSLLPARWKFTTNLALGIGCLGDVIALVGAVAHLWPWGVFWLCFWSTSIPQQVQDLRKPLPPLAPSLSEATA